MSRTLLVTALGILIVVGLAIAGWLGTSYQRDMRVARERITTGSVIETAAGPVEYAESGSGPPMLVIHGAAGGYDQGLLIGRQLLPAGYRMIAPSRFGYIHAGIPEDHSLEAQADVYAALLDALGVTEPVPVVAFSAAGPSGLIFAMRHADRTSALVMISAVSYAEPPGEQSREALESAINRLVSSDFVYWLAVKFATPKVAGLLGIPPETQAQLTPEDWRDVDEVFAGLMPMSDRLAGIAVDQSRDFPREMPLHNIQAPTLVLHAQDDVLVPFSNGEHTAQAIDRAELVPIAYGGHFLAGHGAEVRAGVEAFLHRTGGG
jgi:2-hydroxy-6-oxonona-2,4-dienedioate hydrolase